MGSPGHTIGTGQDRVVGADDRELAEVPDDVVQVVVDLTWLPLAQPSLA